MHEQCVPGSHFYSPTQEPGNETMRKGDFQLILLLLKVVGIVLEFGKYTSVFAERGRRKK